MRNCRESMTQGNHSLHSRLSSRFLPKQLRKILNNSLVSRIGVLLGSISFGSAIIWSNTNSPYFRFVLKKPETKAPTDKTTFRQVVTDSQARCELYEILTFFNKNITFCYNNIITLTAHYAR